MGHHHGSHTATLLMLAAHDVGSCGNQILHCRVGFYFRHDELGVICWPTTCLRCLHLDVGVVGMIPVDGGQLRQLLPGLALLFQLLLARRLLLGLRCQGGTLEILHAFGNIQEPDLVDRWQLATAAVHSLQVAPQVVLPIEGGRAVAALVWLGVAVHHDVSPTCLQSFESHGAFWAFEGADLCVLVDLVRVQRFFCMEGCTALFAHEVTLGEVKGHVGLKVVALLAGEGAVWTVVWPGTTVTHHVADQCTLPVERQTEQKHSAVSAQWEEGRDNIWKGWIRVQQVHDAREKVQTETLP